MASNGLIIANSVVKVPRNRVAICLIDLPQGLTVGHHSALAFDQRLSLLTNSDHPHRQCPISMPGIPAAVVACADFMEPLDAIHCGEGTSLLQVVQQLVTLGIDI